MSGFFFAVKVNKALMELGIAPDRDIPRGYKVQMMDLGKSIGLGPEELAVKIMSDLEDQHPGILARVGSNVERSMVIMRWAGEGKLENLPDDFLRRGFSPESSIHMGSLKSKDNSENSVEGPYTVFVDDNFHYMDEDERYEHGRFDRYEDAVDACKKIVDSSLGYEAGMSAKEIFEKYTMFGEDPWISPNPHGFSAWTYAEKRANEISRTGASPSGEASASVPLRTTTPQDPVDVESGSLGAKIEPAVVEKPSSKQREMARTIGFLIWGIGALLLVIAFSNFELPSKLGSFIGLAYIFLLPFIIQQVGQHYKED